MSNLTDSEITLLNTQVKTLFPGLTKNEVISQLLNQPLIDNPSLPTKIPKKLTTKDFFSKLVGGDRNKVFGKNESDMAPIIQLIHHQDRVGLVGWLDFLLDKNTISQQTHTDITSYLQELIDDPSYQAKIVGQNKLSELIGRGVNSLNGDEIDRIVL